MQKEKQGRCSSVSSPPVQQVSVRQRRIGRPTAVVFLFLFVLPSEGRTEEQPAPDPVWVPPRRRSVVDVLVHADVQQWQWRRRQLPAAGVLELEQVSDLADHTQRLHTHKHTNRCVTARGGGGWKFVSCRQNEIFMEAVCHVCHSTVRRNEFRRQDVL